MSTTSSILSSDSDLQRYDGEDKTSRFKNWCYSKKANISSRAFWMKRLPILNWLSEYSASFFLKDLIAGLTVGLTVIPQGMVCAVVAGLPPQYGFYSAFIPCFVYMFLGTSKNITLGPTAISAMLVKPYADKYGPDAAVLICFISGCIITALGFLQFGFLVDLISMPVLAGFMSAGAITIASSQIAPLLGIKISGSTFLEYWNNVFNRIHETRLWDPVLGFSCIIVLLLLKDVYTYPTNTTKGSKFKQIWHEILHFLSLSRNAIVVSLSTLAIFTTMVASDFVPVRITGPVVEGFPRVSVPNFNIQFDNSTSHHAGIWSEFSSTAVIPFVLIIESIAIAKAYAKGRVIDTTQEMLALGLSNCIGSFFQSFPVTGSFTRTSVNNASGVKTPISGLYTGILVLLCLCFLTKYLQYIPKATMAAVIICVVVFMIKIHEITRTLWKSKKLDLIPLYATFLGCLSNGMDFGMVVGVLVNMIIVLFQDARPKLKVEEIKISGHAVLLVYPDRSITYLSAEYVKDVITEACNEAQGTLFVVVDGRCIHNIDSTAVQIFKSLLEELRARNQPFVLWNWSQDIVKTFVGYDDRDAEFFHKGDSLEKLLSVEMDDGLELRFKGYV